MLRSFISDSFKVYSTLNYYKPFEKMKVSDLLGLASLFTVVLAIDGVVQLDLRKRSAVLNSDNYYLQKRDDETHDVTLEDVIQLGGYYFNVSIGTPAQSVLVQIDTGSSDLWVPGAHNSLCYGSDSDQNKTVQLFNKAASSVDRKSSTYPANPSATESPDDSDLDEDYCFSNVSTFDPETSSSWKKNSTTFPFSIYYGDTTFANGTWGNDIVGFGNLSVENYDLAVATEYNSSIGVFGIGLKELESTNIYGDNYTYPNFPIRLKEEKLIEKIVYSLYSLEQPLPIDSYDEGQVALLFGGVNHAKYEGNLTVLPLVSEYALAITLSGFGLKQGDNVTTISTNYYDALLDSGTTLIQFPELLFQELNETFDFQAIPNDYGDYVIPCSDIAENATFVFDFSGALISVPFDEAAYKQDGSCIFSAFDGDEVILGDTFLRNAYVLYDLEDREVAIAPIKYSDDDDIEAVISTIPSATRPPLYSSTFSGTVEPTKLTVTGNLISSALDTEFVKASSVLNAISSQSAGNSTSSTTASHYTASTKHNEAAGSQYSFSILFGSLLSGLGLLVL